MYVNVNGYAAYDKVDIKYLADRLKAFLPSINIRYTDVNQYPFLRGLNAHYHVMSEEDYKSTLWENNLQNFYIKKCHVTQR